MRRIQISKIKTRISGSEYGLTFDSWQLAIYSPAGKATIDHDPEELLTAIATAVTRGTAQLNLNWVVNGERRSSPKRRILDIMHGRDHVRTILDDEEVALRDIVFDAGEAVLGGELVWKLNRGSAFNGGKESILTPAEMLYSAARVLLPRSAVAPDPVTPDPVGELIDEIRAERDQFAEELGRLRAENESLRAKAHRRTSRR